MFKEIKEGFKICVRDRKLSGQTYLENNTGGTFRNENCI